MSSTAPVTEPPVGADVLGRIENVRAQMSGVTGRRSGRWVQPAWLTATSASKAMNACGPGAAVFVATATAVPCSAS